MRIAQVLGCDKNIRKDGFSRISLPLVLTYDFVHFRQELGAILPELKSLMAKVGLQHY